MRKQIRALLSSHEYVEFLVGRDGDFDRLASSAIRSVRRSLDCRSCAHVLVLPYERAEHRENREAFEDYCDEIEIYPGGGVHPKGAIQARNRYMVDRCDLLLCYVERENGGAWQTLCYARKRGKKIVNLA